MPKIRIIAVTSMLAAFISGPVHALEAGDWTFRAGATGVFTEDLDSDTVSTGATGPITGTAVGPDDAWALGLTLGYAITANWGVELLASSPFTHDIEANGALRQALRGAGLSGNAKIGETTQLPPTLSLTYTFQPESAFRPYLGAGVNYFLSFDDDIKGDLETAGYTDLDVDDSVGLAVQAGFDVDLSDRVFLNSSIRWIDVDVDAQATGGALGPINVNDIAIDPLVFSVMIGTTF